MRDITSWSKIDRCIAYLRMKTEVSFVPEDRTGSLRSNIFQNIL